MGRARRCRSRPAHCAPDREPALLHVHHADRADHLVAALAAVLATPPVDPFSPEVVAVHSRGIERWVSQQLAHHLGATDGAGIAANLRFPFPGRLVADAVAVATRADPDEDPWRAERLTWPLLEVVEAAWHAGDLDDLGPLARHVADPTGGPSPRRLGAIRRVAELFDRYAVHRPELLAAWASDGAVDAGGQPLPARHAWQAALWRRLRTHLDVPTMPERLDEAVAVLRTGHHDDGRPLELDLPDRLAVFGVTALAASSVRVLDALASGPTPTAPGGREVHLFLLHPSPVLWRAVDRVLTDVEVARLPDRDADPTRSVPDHPLLAAWGRDARELQLVVRTVTTPGSEGNDDDDGDGEAARPGDGASASLLRRLQADVTGDRRPWSPGDHGQRPVLARDDRSVQIHRAHGARRQVEVLRDLLLGLLADDPDLEPRDIVVLCPDIETFAPLIAAVFGAQATHEDGGPDLRVQLADRSLRRTDPVLRVLAEVLDLVDDRLTASSVLDLATRSPVRRRFGLDDRALERLEERVASAGIRWGLDGAHRARFDVPTDVNTWRTGLDRLLLGVAVEDEGLRSVGGLPPDAHVEGEDVDLVGRLAELVDRLDQAVQLLTGPHPLPTWLEHLTTVAGLLCGEDAEGRDGVGGPGTTLLTRVLTDVRDSASHAGRAQELPLTLPEIRGLLGDRLQGAPSRASHRTGDLTVCTLVPMRSVPHEVVVLLGMDDEVFPRRAVPDGDDLLAAAPRVGDRDARSEDRQLLLDAVLAARSTLVVLTTGRDERTNDPRPPAVPVGELLDVIDRTVTSDVPRDGEGAEVVPASQLVTVDHPLQPFDATRFVPGGLGHDAHPATLADQPFGFDEDELEAARVGTRPVSDPPPFLQGLLPPADDERPTTLHELTSFLAHPCEALLAQRLHLRFPRSPILVDDEVPIALPRGLERWRVGQRLFGAAAAGRSPERAIQLERHRGLLPPDDLAEEPLAGIRGEVEQLVTAARDLGVDISTPGRAHDVDLTLPSGRRLVGTVDDVVGTTRRHASFARLSPRTRLTAWIEVLALTAQEPSRPWTAVSLGLARDEAGQRGGKKAAVSVSHLGALGEVAHRLGRKQKPFVCTLGGPSTDLEDRRRRAVELLERLLDLRDRGLADALPLPCRTGHAFAYRAFLDHHGLGTGKTTPASKGRQEWETVGDGGRGRPREDRDVANVRLLGTISFARLQALPALDDEVGDGWFDDVDDGRFGRLARRVWWPLLGNEQLDDWYPT